MLKYVRNQFIYSSEISTHPPNQNLPKILTIAQVSILQYSKRFSRFSAIDAISKSEYKLIYWSLAVLPTINGIREGRDEVLEAAYDWTLVGEQEVWISHSIFISQYLNVL